MQTKTTTVMLFSLIAAFGCETERSREFQLGDQWSESIERHYVEGTTIRLELRERVDTDCLVSCPDVLRELDEDDVVELASMNRSVVEVSSVRLEATAVSAGSTDLVLRVNGREAVRERIHVGVPTRIDVQDESAGPMRFVASVLDGDERLWGGLGDEVEAAAGGALELHARYFIGDTRYFGDQVLGVDTLLDTEPLADAPQGNTIRFTPLSGRQDVRLHVAGFTRTIVVDASYEVDALRLVEIPTGGSLIPHRFRDEETARRYDVIFPIAEREEAPLNGDLPVTWVVDGALLGPGSALAVEPAEGAEVEVLALMDDARVRLVLPGMRDVFVLN